MRIATLQFNPTLGAVAFNATRASSLLASLSPATELDLLVLPELALTGYNFPSLEAIKPYLEPTAAGSSTIWAIETAKRLHCHVTVGYPERCDEDGRCYNSTVTVSPAGDVLLNYRKSFLYYTDETWASEGPSGTCAPVGHKANHTPFFAGSVGNLEDGITIGHGICMDINPYKFTAPWSSYEFANCMLQNRAKIIIISMAWLTRLVPEDLSIEPASPDMETVACWLERFFPFVTTDEEIIVVFANRCGTEGRMTGTVKVEEGGEVEMGDRVCYAGSSCVMKFQAGGVRIFERDEGPGILGKGEEGVLLVDTEKPARYALHSR